MEYDRDTLNFVLGSSGTRGLTSDLRDGGSGTGDVGKALGTSELQSSILALRESILKLIKEKNEHIDQIPMVESALNRIDIEGYFQQPWKPIVSPYLYPKSLGCQNLQSMIELQFVKTMS